jgi:hypothetical protein
MQDQQSRSVSLTFDAVEFVWKGLPQKKYDNFMKMRHMQASPDCFTVDGYPYMIQLEPTNRCNLKCPRCPAGTNPTGRPRHISPHLWSERRGCL